MCIEYEIKILCSQHKYDAMLKLRCFGFTMNSAVAPFVGHNASCQSFQSIDFCGGIDITTEQHF